MKRKLLNLLFGLIFLTGFGILTYPTISDQWNTYRQSQLISSYEQAVGHRTGGSQIYYVLRRHGWRKVMPRSKHPKKASEEVIETSKKLKKK